MKKIDIKEMQLIINTINAANVLSNRLSLTWSSSWIVCGITHLFISATT